MFQYAPSTPLPLQYQEPMTVWQCILRAAAPMSSYMVGGRSRQPKMSMLDWLSWSYHPRYSDISHSDVTMSAMVIQINHRLDSLPSRLFRRRSKKNQSSASVVFVMGIHRWPANPPPPPSQHTHKGPVARIFFPFDDVAIGGFYQFSFGWGT